MHELGHVFGLRHFFANEKETHIRSEIFGHHQPMTIMNYGKKKQLTRQDKHDLERLYRYAWDGDIGSIRGLPIRFFKPYSSRKN